MKSCNLEINNYMHINIKGEWLGGATFCNCNARAIRHSAGLGRGVGGCQKISKFLCRHFGWLPTYIFQVLSSLTNETFSSDVITCSYWPSRNILLQNCLHTQAKWILVTKDEESLNNFTNKLFTIIIWNCHLRDDLESCLEFCMHEQNYFHK